MRRTRGVVSLSLAVAAAAQLLYIPAGRAQSPPGGEPEAQAPDSNVAPPPGPAPMPPGYGQPVAGPFVTLRADSPKARLQMMGQQLRWQDICVTPCRVAVNPTGEYRVAGNTIRPSDTFNMPRPSGQVLIEAQVGSTVKHWVGIALIIGGVLDAGFGAIYYAGASDLANSNSNTTGMTTGYFQAVGIVGIVTGVILLAIGIPLSLSSTSVDVR
jgi:hypothetical protein